MQQKNPLYGANTFKKALEDDSEDGYISPQDISIKDEKIWDPTDEEILSYALKLGYDIEKDPDELFEVAYYYMKYPLPEGWKRGIMKTTKELVYINFLTGEIEVSTEIEEMAHQMYLEKKSEMNQKNISIFKNPPEKKEITTVVPRKKIPPINPLQKSNNSNGIKSLPGINSNSKSNKKNDDLQFSNKKNDINKDINFDYYKNQNENIIKLNNNIDKFLENSINEKEFKDLYNNKNNIENNDKNEIKNNENKNKEKELKLNLEENKKKNYEFFLNLQDDEEEDEELEEGEEEEDIIHKDDKEEKDNKEDSFLQQMLKREKEIEELRKQKEKDIENALNKNDNLKNIIDIKKIKCESDGGVDGEKKNEKNSEKKSDIAQNPENIKLFKEKKEYLKKKLEELQEYKEEKKIIYQDKKDEYEKLKNEKNNNYKNKLKEGINKNKQKLEKQFKEKLELYEKQLINKKNKEEKKYKDELIHNIKSKKEEDKEVIKKREEKQKEELKQKKNELLKEIENLKKVKIINETNLSQKKINLQKNILLIEEKKNLEKKNKTKKNELEIKNIENNLEKEFQQNKQNLSKKYTKLTLPLPLPLPAINENNNLDDDFKPNLLNDIQKVIDEEYEMNCKAFEQELENKKLKEIDKYINMMTNDKNEQIDFYKSEISSLQKDYYKSISNIRNNCQKNKFNNENILKLKFEQTLNGYEQTKKIILEQNKQLMNHINDNLHKLLIGNYSLKQTEIKLDEFLLNLKDTYLLVYQKNKNNFDMYENDYIFKTQFIKYLLDIINHMIQLFNTKAKTQKDNNNNEDDILKNESERNMAENLLLFCNEKINEYRKKYKKVKNISIFSFMNGNLMKSQSFDNSNIHEFDDINKTILFDATSRRRRKKNNNNEINDTIDKNINININTKNNINSNNEIDSNIDNINGNINTNNNNIPQLIYIEIDKEKNTVVPTIPENVLSNLNEDILMLYSDIILFLKSEYNKILQINQKIKENNNNNNISTNLNIIILDKIKSYSEESFNYLLVNYKKNDQHLNIKKKLRLILNHIEEYKNNFNLDKYLSNNNTSNNNNNNNNNNIEEDTDIVNQMPINNQKMNKNYTSINNYINKTQDITNNYKANNKNNSKKFSSVNEVIKEKEEQKQSGDDLNLSKSVLANYNKNNIYGTFNNFYRYYNTNTLSDKMTNPSLYKFFNYKKNKYELDKSLGKITMP